MVGRPGIAEKRLSIHRFQQLPDQSGDHLKTPNDVTIDIPLTAVTSSGQTGARKSSVRTTPSQRGYQPPGEAADVLEDANEKAELGGLGHRGKRIDSARARSLDDPEDGTITRMGRFYQHVLNFSIVTRYLIYVLPLSVLIAIPIIVGQTAAPDATIGGVGITWFFLWIEVVWWSLWVGKLVARALPFVFQFLCGIVSSGTRKYALILQNLQIPIATVLWSVISLITFLPIMQHNPQRQAQEDTTVRSWEKSVKNVLFALLVCSLIFLGEKAIVQLISISYHRKQFDLKIKASKRNVNLLAELYDASRNMFPMYCKEFREEDAAISDLIATKTNGMPRSSSTPMRLLRGVGQNVGRLGDKVTAAFGDVAHELTGKEVFNPTSARSIVTLALERRKSSEALARRIWMSFVIEGRDALWHEDIAEVLGEGKELQAQEAFLILDRDGNGDISLDEMILAVAEIQKTKKALHHSLHDVDQAIHVLDNLLLGVAFIIGLLVFISFVTSGFGTVIAAAATSLLSLSFVFATTAQEVLGSCIFLFVKHPFDVGDRVEVDSKAYNVERISLLFTVFRNLNDQRTTQVPNAVLNTLWIDNLTRSGAMHEVLNVGVNFDTTFADIQRLKEEMEKFVRDKENSRDFQDDIHIDVVGVGTDMEKMELSVTVSHKSNWANETVRASRRSKFMCALILAVRKLKIRGTGVAAEEDAADDDNNGDDNNDGKLKGESTQKPFPPDVQDRDHEHSPRPHTASSFQDHSKATSSSTAIDLQRSYSDSLHRRGGATSASTYGEGKYPEPVLTRSPASGGDNVDTYQTPNASPRGTEHLGVQFGSLAREASTGRRKEGTTTHANNNLHPGAAGGAPSAAEGSAAGTRTSIPTATGGVPILSAPVPPRQAGTPPVHQRTVAEYYRSTPGQFYDPQDGPYDPTQPYELPSVFDDQGVVHSASVYRERARSPSLPSSIQPSPTNARFEDETMPGAFVSRRPQGH